MLLVHSTTRAPGTAPCVVYLLRLKKLFKFGPSLLLFCRNDQRKLTKNGVAEILVEHTRALRAMLVVITEWIVKPKRHEASLGIMASVDAKSALIHCG